jgi:hypothetical protein
VRLSFEIGEIVGIDPGYNAGIWLRSSPASKVSSEGSHVPNHSLLLIVGIDTTQFSRDPSIRVLSECGTVGWTFSSRLKKI